MDLLLEVGHDRQLFPYSCRPLPHGKPQFLDLFAKEEFRQLATEFAAKANELDVSSKHPGRVSEWLSH